jgi:hypothetical protein
MKDGIFSATEATFGATQASTFADGALALVALDPPVSSSGSTIVHGLFRLSPHTEVTFSALVQVALSEPRPSDFAYVAWNVGSGSPDYDESHSIRSSLFNKSSDTSSARRVFLSVTNDTSTEGPDTVFDAQTAAFAASVPEPVAYVGVLMGLCAAGLILREKRNSRNWTRGPVL